MPKHPLESGLRLVQCRGGVERLGAADYDFFIDALNAVAIKFFISLPLLQEASLPGK